MTSARTTALLLVPVLVATGCAEPSEATDTGSTTTGVTASNSTTSDGPGTGDRMPWCTATVEPPRFRDVTAEVGLAVPARTAAPAPDCLEYDAIGDPRPYFAHCQPPHMTGGVAIADVDENGWPDLWVTRFGTDDRLWLNEAGQFTDHSATIAADTRATNGVALVDLNADGHLDAILSTVLSGEGLVLQGDGSGGFQQTGRFATSPDTAGQSVTPADLDGDGQLEVFVGAWGFLDPGERSGAGLWSATAAAPWTFSDMTEASGLPTGRWGYAGAWPFAATVLDLQDRGHPQLAIAGDFETSTLWTWSGSRFVDDTQSAGVGLDENGMGLAVGDVNGDARLDLFVTGIYDPGACTGDGPCDWQASGNRLYVQRPDGSFVDATADYGVADSGWGWGAAFFDADADGDQDLIAVGGVDFPDVAQDDRFAGQVPTLWHNDGAPPWSSDRAVPGLGSARDGRAVAAWDYDGDGDEDLLITHTLRGPTLLRNEADPMRRVTLRFRLHPRRRGIAPAVLLEQGDGQTLRIAPHTGLWSHTDGTLSVVIPQGCPRPTHASIRWVGDSGDANRHAQRVELEPDTTLFEFREPSH